MSLLFQRPSCRQMLLVSASSLLLFGDIASAPAQGTSTAAPLPEISVTAPSPIKRRVVRPARLERRIVRSAARVAPEQTPQPALAQPNTPPGTLPVVTDQFATVTVVPSEELRRGPPATLGDLLNNKPGITGSSFAPGASSRPVIRGLDVNRVGIVENGIGSGGVSDLGEDHFVPVDPIATNQIEVIRGPATLRYGSQAIGGVVSASNNRIPDTMPCPTAAPCLTGETRSALSSVDHGAEGGVLLDAGGNNIAVHADAFGRRSGDYAIPASPYRFDPVRAFNGRQPNSAAQANGGSLGGSYFFSGGFFGAAVTQNNSLYHIPGIDGEEHRTRIDAQQTKVTAKGEYRPDASAVEAIRFWGGATDYRHNEIGLADPADSTSDGVRQSFTSKEQEGRVEFQLAPFNLRFAQMTTALGAQASHQELTAPSPDDPGSQLNGLWDPNRNTKVAGYIFNEFKISGTTKAQIAGRVETVSLHGMTPSFIPGLFDINVNPGDVGPTTPRDLSYTPKSASVGLIQNLPLDLVASVTGQYIERAPKPAELFSRGAHDATGTFDIGSPNLTLESARTFEAGLRRATGPLRFELTGYYTWFDNFIYRRLTGNTCEDGACVAANDPNPLELKQAIYSQRDAAFRGAEFQFQYELAPVFAGVWGIEGQYDIVRATFTDGSNVPRIPPQRLGGGLFYRDGNWLARVNLLHAFAQNNIAPPETSTPGYNRLKAELSYNVKLKPSATGARELTVGVIGDNLLNDDIRNSVSYNKDEVLLPGASVRIFANVKY